MFKIDEKVLAADIKSIKVRGAKLDQDIQQAALRAIQVADKEQGTGNIHYVNALYAALGKGARHVALTEWYTGFGGLEANTGADKDYKPFLHSKVKVMDLEAAKATPWYDMKPSPAPDEVIDYLKLALVLLKKKPKEGQAVAHVALRDKIAELVEEAQTVATMDDGEGGLDDDGEPNED